MHNPVSPPGKPTALIIDTDTGSRMTVRTAELIFAILLALCSIGLMVKSAELKIGWIEGEGPGSGAWPFWLSAGMLAMCLLTIYRWVKKITPESRSLEPYMTRDTVIVVGVSAASLLGLLLATQYLGIYVSLIVFLVFYLRIVGHHSWPLTISLAICIPFAIFCLFEIALTIPLPKAITDPVFYPVYDLIYAKSFKEQLATLKHPIVSVPIFAVLGVLIYWVRKWFVQRGLRNTDSARFESGRSEPDQADAVDGEAP